MSGIGIDSFYVLKSEDSHHIHAHGAWALDLSINVGDRYTNDYGSPVVIGEFECIDPHVSTADTEPGVGSNWATVWIFVGIGATGPTGATGAQGASSPAKTCNARLTFESGVPVSFSDQVNKQTLYLTPYKGNELGLYYSGAWTVHNFSEVSLSIAALIANSIYDIFAHWNGSAVVLSALLWKKITATSSPTAGTNKVISVNDTTGVVAGDYVTVADVSHSELARVNAVVASTSITVDSLANSYTLPSINYPSRGTALVMQDGVLSLSGDTTKRYMGSIFIGGTAGYCDDSALNRCLWNFYNQKKRLLRWIVDPSVGSWSLVSNTTWRGSNGQVTYKVRFLYPIQEDIIRLMTAQETSGTGYHASVGIGHNRTNGNDALSAGCYSGGTANLVTTATYDDIPNLGIHDMFCVEIGDSAGTAYGHQAATRFCDFNLSGEITC